MTDKDKEIVRKAKRMLNTANYFTLGAELQEQCDTDDARYAIDDIMRRLYHKEEAENGME